MTVRRGEFQQFDLAGLDEARIVAGLAFAKHDRAGAVFADLIAHDDTSIG